MQLQRLVWQLQWPVCNMACRPPPAPPAAAAPEQLMGQRCTLAADLFSLGELRPGSWLSCGAVLWQLALAGEAAHAAGGSRTYPNL